MKTLLILRHAKAKRGPEYSSDANRPLSKQGKEDAIRVGQVYREMGLLPDTVLSSPAKRARQTAERFCQAAGYAGEIHFRDKLYSGGLSEHVAALRELPDTAQIALLVGHNPALEELLTYLTLQSASLPTAALAQVELSIASWAALGQGTGRVKTHGI